MLTLIQFNPDEKQKPQTFRLTSDRTHVIGRRHGDVQLLDSRISRQHAEVSVQNGTWVIRDLSSSNGTWVNGDRVEGLCELEEGDRLVLGRITLIVGHVEASDSTPDSSAPSLSQATAIDVDALEAELSDDSQAIAGADDDGLDLDVELGLDAVDLDLDDEDAESPEDAAVSVAALEAELDPAGPEIDLDSAEASSEIEALDLHDSAGASSIDLGASSDLPQAASTTDQPSESPVAGDDLLDASEDEDEYAASMEFIAPVVSRPDSPLDAVGASADAEGSSETTSDNIGAVNDDAGVNADDDAPEVVGLSLDLPAPELDDLEVDEKAEAQAAAEIDDDEAAADVSDHADESLHEDENGVSIERALAEAEDVGDLTLDDESIETAATVGDPREQTPEREAGVAVQREAEVPRDPDWAEPEAQQEINTAWSGRGGSRGKKGLAVLVLLAIAGGVAFWAINANDTATPIAGSPSSGEASETGEPSKNLAHASTRGATGGAEDQAESAAPPATADELPTLPEPRLADLPDDAADVPETPSANAFGQAPTLPGNPPATADPAAPATTSPPVQVPAAEVASTPEPQPGPPPTDAPSTSIEPLETEAPEIDRPTLAMLEPAPNRDPFADPLLNIPAPAPENDRDDAASPDARRIAFVVDASGSMVDSMSSGALAWLDQTLRRLNERDSFTVLFFRSNEVIEVPPAGLKEADSVMRETVLDWAAPASGNIRPRGKSEPLNALRQAQAYQPTDIYILSDDKFGQRRAAASIDSRDLEPLLGDNPATVHTVQFFYKSQDDPRLEAIAQQFGGTYEFVKEPPFDIAPGSDLGVDLIGISR